MQVITIGLDLAKHVFQVHGVDQEGRVILRRRLRRAEVVRFFSSLPPCLVGIEACSTAHHWARELIGLGHEVRLMPPTYVKPYVKRGKNDAADAEAICEAVTRPNMRFVPIKSAEQQSVLVLHRARDLLIRQRTMLANSLRAHCAEFGIVVAQGMAKLAELLARIADEADTHIPSLARGCLLVLGQQLQELQLKIGEVERALHGWHRSNEAAWRPSPASAQSPPVRWPARSPTPRSSAQAAISRRGSGSCPDRTRVAVRSGSGAFQSKGTAISGAC